MSNQALTQFALSKILPTLVAATSVGVITTVSLPAAAASLIPVDVELALLVDISGSMDDSEYALQMKGYQDAFTKIAPLFGSGDLGNVAVTLIQWSVGSEQSIPWTLLNDQASALKFADTIGTLTNSFPYSTAAGYAIEFATPLFGSNDFDGQRWVIDVSGDGASNFGTSTSLARDKALAAGVSVINGLPIIASDELYSYNLEEWYRNNVQGGDESFTIAANGYEDIGRALEQKLLRELSLAPQTPPVGEAVPEPTTLLGVLLAGSGITYLKRRQRTI